MTLSRSNSLAIIYLAPIQTLTEVTLYNLRFRWINDQFSVVTGVVLPMIGHRDILIVSPLTKPFKITKCNVNSIFSVAAIKIYTSDCR